MTGEDPKRARSLHLSPADQTRLREAAAAAGKTNSEYLDLIAADDPDCQGGADARRAGGAAGRGSRDAFLRAAKAGHGSGLDLPEAL